MAKDSKRKKPFAPSATSEPALSRSRENVFPWLFLLKVLCVVAAGLWALTPALPGDWGGDDELYLTNNPLRHDPAQLWKTWFAPGSFIEYYPITETVQMVQWSLWHHDSSGYLWTNIILHLVNALLIWHLLHLLGLRQGWLGALVFAVHPMTVESVAWISELKNTLSLTPFLLAMGCWIRFDETKRGRDYALALGWFVLAMLCKISMAPFAVVILLYAWWKRGRIDRADIGASLPFFVVALVLGGLTCLAGAWFAQRYAHPALHIPLDGFLSRLALVGLTGAFYFAKFFWPWTPAPLYPQWNIDPSAPWQFLPWLALGGALYWCWNRRQGWGRHVLLGGGYFFLMLAPLLGFLEVPYMTFTWVMDHFLYLPMIGLIGLVVAGMEQAYNALSPSLRPWSAGGLALLLLALALETRSYAGIYSNQELLFAYDLRINPDSFTAHDEMGNALMKKGDLDGAVQQFHQALVLNPGSDQVHFDLGTALMQANRLEEARDEFQEAIRLVPDYADACDNLGATLQQLGHLDEAMAQFRRAIQISDFGQAHNDLGNALLQAGRTDEAIAEYQKAAQLNSDVAQVRDNLALALCQAKRVPEAIEQFQAALAIDPRDESARNALEKLQGAPP